MSVTSCTDINLVKRFQRNYVEIFTRTCQLQNFMEEAFTDNQKTHHICEDFSLEISTQIICLYTLHKLLIRSWLTLSVDCPDGLSTLAFWCSRLTPSAFSALINTTNGQNCWVRRTLRACGEVKVTNLKWSELGKSSNVIVCANQIWCTVNHEIFQY